MGRYHGPESIHLRIGKCCHNTARTHASMSVGDLGFEQGSDSDWSMIWLNEKMMYKMESRVLSMWFAVVLMGFDKLIHQLGQYLRHLVLHTSEQDVSQLIPQRANTQISRR